MWGSSLLSKRDRFGVFASRSVREALAKKDYETAVGGLLALRGAATGQERYEAYLALYGEVIDTLRVEQSTDRKAAQALAQLNLATRGR
jgi:hypothetical protein